MSIKNIKCTINEQCSKSKVKITKNKTLTESFTEICKFKKESKLLYAAWF